MFYDTDCGGVVHNLAYLRWVEECRTKYAMADGMNFAEMLDEQRCFVVVRHEVDYLFPATLHDRVRISIVQCKGSASTLAFDFELRRVSDDKLLVRVHQKLAYLNTATGLPCRMPAEMKGRFYD